MRETSWIFSTRKAGIAVPAEDSEALAEALITLLDHASERPAMGQRGRTNIEENFSRRDLRETLLEALLGNLAPSP